MPDFVEDLKNAVIESIKKSTGKFLEDHQDAKDFVTERAKRLSELAFSYKTAADDAAREKAKEQLEIVEQSIKNELSSVAVDASAKSRATFQAVVSAAVEVLVKAIPVLVSWL